MIDLSINYLGLNLRNPLVCAASPLCEEVENLQRMEDAGAAAVVLPSLFEEQLDVESRNLHRIIDISVERRVEELSYLPEMRDYNRGPAGYLELVRTAKQRLDIPVIASLNGTTPGGWVGFSRRIAEAGADALELNIYWVPTDPALSGGEIEHLYTDLVAEVKANIRIPVAVKLSPYFSSFASFARDLDQAGADGIVLFNRFYQPDFDLEKQVIVPSLHLSTPDELLLRLHWAAILFGRVKAHLGVTGGVHSSHDVLKVLMAGGRVAMIASALLKYGIDHLTTLLMGLEEWMVDREYSNVEQFLGSMSMARVSDPGAYQRANYMKVLQTFATRGLT